MCFPRFCKPIVQTHSVVCSRYCKPKWCKQKLCIARLCKPHWEAKLGSKAGKQNYFGSDTYPTRAAMGANIENQSWAPKLLLERHLPHSGSNGKQYWEAKLGSKAGKQNYFWSDAYPTREAMGSNTGKQSWEAKLGSKTTFGATPPLLILMTRGIGGATSS